MTDRVRKPEWLKINIGAPNELADSYQCVMREMWGLG